MKAYIPWNFSLSKYDADQKLLILQQLKVRGNGRTPEAPRDVQARSGARGALLTWKLPVTGADWIRGWRVYKDNENNLYQEIQDPGTRQLYVDLSSGANPPVTNFFVSAISAAGAESQATQVKAVSLAEAGAPGGVPALPPEYSQEVSAGASHNPYGVTRK